MRPAFLCEANGLRRPVQAVQVPKVQQQLRVPCKQPLTSSTASVLHAERLSSCAQATCSQRFDRLAMHATAAEVKRPPTDAPPSGKASSPFMQERMQFLQEDLKHLFDDQGLDKSQYDDVVKFRDPITRFNRIQGYMFNISMLRQVFAPNFEMHDIKQTGEHEITTRWTMTMQFTLNRISPLRRFWDPKLIFTGISIMGINPDNGKVNKHIDLWDAVKNNTWFSLEAAGHVGKQMTSLMRVPDLESFKYTVLRKTKDYEIRRFEPFNVIQADLPQPQASSNGAGGFDPAGQATDAFRALAGFLFGKNKEEQKFSMTMPVITDTTGHMRFILPSTIKDADSIPAPLSGDVTSSRQPGGIWAVRPFTGVANSERSRTEAEELRRTLERDRLKPSANEWALARYNDPSTKPWFRRNEVLMPVDNFELWGN